MAVKKGGCVEDLHVLSETGKGGEDSRVLAALMGPRKRRETRRPTIFFLNSLIHALLSDDLYSLPSITTSFNDVVLM